MSHTENTLDINDASRSPISGRISSGNVVVSSSEQNPRSTPPGTPPTQQGVPSTPPLNSSRQYGPTSLTAGTDNAIRAELLLDPTFDPLEAENCQITEVDLSEFYADMPGAGTYCTIIDGLIRREEAEEWIKLTESYGYSEALVNGRDFKDIRNSGRCMIDDSAAAAVLYDRIFKVLRSTRFDERIEPFAMNGGRNPAVGVNDRFRFLRYTEGQYFKPHFDGSYQRPDGRSRSMVTVQLYLNEGMEGGATTILSPSVIDHDYDEDEVIAKVVPKVGRVLLFDHKTMHEGALLTGGVKYAVRTEIMYSTIESY